MLKWLSVLLSLSASAAPFPGTGSSPLVSGKPGLFQSEKGFKLNAASTAWVQSPIPKRIPSLVTIYKSPIPINGQSPALTVRVDEMEREQGLKAYVKRWMQDYTRFGFDVLAAKPIMVNAQTAFLLDIVSHETRKQLRQVVFIKEKIAVILTCRDQRESFAKTVLDCNEIIKTFEWTK
ncbi:MAG: hypothetical protein AB7G93_07550 [Bdellovibrionales bacterium]